MKKYNYSLTTLEDVFKGLETNKGKIGIELLSEAQFLKETLDRLKLEIKDNELVGEMKQGNYSIDRSNPALKTYNSTITNYQKIIKQITDLLPKEKTKEELELEEHLSEFDNF